MATLPHTSAPSSEGSSTVKQHTVIIGAGIIGCATAYYLSRDRTLKSTNSVHLVESSPELFASASGKSGGFLAEDWFDSASCSLGELSFRLHRELANEHNGLERWGYSRSTGTSFIEGRPGARKRDRANGNGLSQDWLADGGSRAEQVSGAAVHEFKSHDEDGGPVWLNRRHGDSLEVLGEEGTLGQVDPLRLSHFLLNESLKAGVVLHQPARPLSLSGSNLTILSTSNGKSEVETLPCTHLLIASGAWTPRVFSALFPNARCKIPISAYAGHSLVLRSPRWTALHEPAGCHAVFASARKGLNPEIFSRIGGEVYIAGLNSTSIALPETATDAAVEASSIAQLKAVAARYLGEKEGDIQVVREGLCFRPVTPGGAPIVAKVSDQQLRSEGDGGLNVFVAAGHGPWGISLSLGTGKVMAEMLHGMSMEDLSADIQGMGLQ